jgi:hypothetical protein
MKTKKFAFFCLSLFFFSFSNAYFPFLMLINKASRGILTASGERIFQQVPIIFQSKLNLFALRSKLFCSDVKSFCSKFTAFLLWHQSYFDLTSELFYSTIGHFYTIRLRIFYASNWSLTKRERRPHPIGVVHDL